MRPPVVRGPGAGKGRSERWEGVGCQDCGQRGDDLLCQAEGGRATRRPVPAVRRGRENGTP